MRSEIEIPDSAASAKCWDVVHRGREFLEAVKMGHRKQRVRTVKGEKTGIMQYPVAAAHP